jgi:redox-sensitive bicupin YhaK (pirin superfamily)
MRSPARTDSPLVGLELDIDGGGGELPLDASYEHALVVLSGVLVVDDQEVAPDVLVYLGMGRSSLRLTASQPCRALLLGGEPFGEEVLMWWNFVARTRDEVDEAYRDWQAESSRFGEPRSPLARIPAPPPVWMHR